MDGSIEALRERLAYDPETGALTWKVAAGDAHQTKVRNANFSGKPAGSLSNRGYIRVWLNGRLTPGHRIAFALHFGRWPSAQIDHKNGDRADNRIANLREATAAENARNARTRHDNKSGIKGVCWHKDTGKWHASISVNGRQRYLGVFETKQAAADVRQRAAGELHGEFARAG